MWGSFWINFQTDHNPSSAGEHMTEDHGVPGSTPGGPIFKIRNKDSKLEKIFDKVGTVLAIGVIGSIILANDIIQIGKRIYYEVTGTK